MRASLFLCIAAALSTGCASNPTVPVAADQASTAPASVAANGSETTVAQAGEPVSLEIVQTPAPSTATSAQGEKLVCKEIARIGTRLTRRVCKTQEQIAFEREQAQSVTEGHQRPAPLQDSTGQVRGLAIH